MRLLLLLHSLLNIDVTRDTSQASMAPCVEPASQPAPVPDSQGPLFEEEQYELSVPALLKRPPHAPTPPNSAVCSALRSAKAAASAPCRPPPPVATAPTSATAIPAVRTKRRVAHRAVVPSSRHCGCRNDSSGSIVDGTEGSLMVSQS